MKSIVEMAQEYKLNIEKTKLEEKERWAQEIAANKKECAELEDFILSVFKEVDGINGIQLIAEDPREGDWAHLNDKGFSNRAKFALKQGEYFIAAGGYSNWSAPEYNSDYGCDTGGYYYCHAWVLTDSYYQHVDRGREYLSYFHTYNDNVKEKFRKDFAKYIAKYIGI